MAAVGDLIAFVVVAFVIVAGLSLLTIGAPATPLFARRTATSATVQLRHPAPDHLIRGSMESVRSVRRNPYPQLSVLLGVRHGCHSPAPSGQSVRKL
jgi:hypothetical protein